MSQLSLILFARRMCCFNCWAARFLLGEAKCALACGDEFRELSLIEMWLEMR